MVLVDGAQLGVNHAVLYLDLDQFKLVNDTCGHAAGDELLRQIALLLRPRLREGDTLARLGGDEFGVLLEHCAAGPALHIAQMLRTAVADFRFVWKDRAFNVGVSVGVVNVSDASQTLAAVLSAADAACYMAKDNGRNRVQVYSPDSNEVALRHGEMEWVNRLHSALAEHRFCLFAQPVCGTRGDSQTPPYTELLLRLRDENNQLIPPAEFLLRGQRYNLMPDIDRWVDHHGVRHARAAPRGERRRADRREHGDQHLGRVDRRGRIPRFRARPVHPVQDSAHARSASRSRRRPR